MDATMHRIRRKEAGFTIVELLAVIAVLGVVLAIAAPNLVHIARVTNMSRLDSTAKELYIALQDQLIGMEASGECATFNQIVESAAAERGLDALDAMPQDAPDSSWLGYYYLTNYYEGEASAALDADSAFEGVLHNTSVVESLLGSARVIVEVNPRGSGADVYSVFYSEDPEFSYADVRGLASRSYEDRSNTGRGYPVGYYCGYAADVSEIPDYFAPRATFINGEELFLHVVCPGGLGLVGNEGKLLLRLTLDDGLNTHIVEYVGGQDFFLDPNGNIDVDIVIDSMREGLHITDLFPSLIPGADITASVEVEYDNNGALVSTPFASRGQAKANSLYAGNTAGAIEVANVRHMNNLRLLPGETVGVTQTANIDFDAASWGTAERTSLSSSTRSHNQETYGVEYVNPLAANPAGGVGFTPIQTDGAGWSFDGGGNLLSNFVISGAGPTGLFESVQAAQTIVSVTLVDPVVQGAGPMGALCGSLAGTVENCGVRLDIASRADAAKESERVVQADSGGDVGGLIGVAEGSANILRSYAAINVVAPSAESAGGLVGRFASTGSLESCYASGAIRAGGPAGGLIGLLEGGNVSKCYATSEVSAPVSAGGFAGIATDGSVSSCVSFGRIDSEDGGGFCGAAADQASFSECRYLRQLNYNDRLYDQPSGVSGVDYGTLSNPTLSAGNSHPYTEALRGEVFPFSPILEEHWGNWPAPINMNPLLVYYELYGDGSYGYFGSGTTSESLVEINTLDESLVVMEDGYALLSVYPIRGFDYNLNNGQATGSLRLSESVADGSYVELPSEGVTYWNGSEYNGLSEVHIYQLPYVLQMPSRQAEYLLDSLELTFAGLDSSASVVYTYYYNPDFAKLSSSPDIEGNTAVPDTSELLVRTARQLNRLAYQPTYWASVIAQERDIDFGFYASTYMGHSLGLMDTNSEFANQSIGVAGDPFVGTYDGRNYAVIDYQQRANGQSQAGLFGDVSGTVRNVHIATSVLDSASIVRTGSAGGSSAYAVGALVGWLNGGSVEGCSVSGYRIFVEGSTAVNNVSVGGLVGLNQGTVVESSAANVRVHARSDTESGAVVGAGGLVGGSSGVVERCYGVENTLECLTTTSGSGRAVSLGGVVGYAFDGSPAISDCYGYCFAGNIECSVDDSMSYYSVADSSNVALFNCYTLDPLYLGLDAADAPQDDPAAVVLCTPAELQDAALAGFAGFSTPRNTYGDTMAGHIVQSSGNYPYPVICKDAYGEWTHFGFDWRE